MLFEEACRSPPRHEVALSLNLAGIGDVSIGRGTPVRLITDAAHLATLLYNGAWLSGLLGQGALFVHPDTRATHEAVRMIFPDTNAYRCRLDGY